MHTEILVHLPVKCSFLLSNFKHNWTELCLQLPTNITYNYNLVNGFQIVKCRETEVGIDRQLKAELIDGLLQLLQM